MDIHDEVKTELERARSKFPRFHSFHEGYAIIAEEMDELWGEIRRHDHNVPEMREEAIQIAAMAIRFVEDLCL